MIYRVLAELVLVLHLGFIVFALLGGLLAVRWRWVVYAHLPCVVWGVFIAAIGWVCPLTPLENRLRRRAGDAGYEGGFIEHYLTSIVYPEGLTRSAQLVLAGILLATNVVAYALVWRKQRAARRGDDDAS